MTNAAELDKPQAGDLSGCMPSKPQAEHEWLHQLVGDWTYESECLMGPDQPPMKSSGTQSYSSIGGLWLVGDGTGCMPDGSPAKTRITLGYDPLSFLVAPRVVAGVVMFPVVVAVAMLVSVAAGGVASVGLLHLSTAEFAKGVRLFFHTFDVEYGLVKASSFGAAVTLIGASAGNPSAAR